MSSTRRNTALGLVFSVVVIDLLGFGMVLPILPVYAKEFTATYSDDQAAWILGALMVCFSVMQFCCAPLWGRLSDRVGRRPILLMSLAGSSFFYFVFGIATREASLIGMFVSRIGAGIAGASIPTAQAYIADVTPTEKRTSGMALIGAAFALGMTFGPLIGAVALLSAADAGASPWPGYTASGLSTVALLLAYFKLPESLSDDAASRRTGYLDLTSLRQALTTPSIGLLLVTSFVYIFALAVFEGVLPLGLASYLGVERGGYQILLCFAVIGLIKTIVQGVFVRRAATRVADWVLVTIGVSLSLIGYVALALAAEPSRGSTVWLMFASGIEVVGLAFLMPSVQSLISRRVDPEKQGVILGTASSVSSMARITGMMAGIRLYYHVPSHPFWCATGCMCLAAVLVSVAIQRGHDWKTLSDETPDSPQPASAEN